MGEGVHWIEYKWTYTGTRWIRYRYERWREWDDNGNTIKRSKYLGVIGTGGDDLPANHPDNTVARADLNGNESHYGE